MNFILVGTNHKTSPIEIRERLSFSKKRLRDTLFLLKESEVVKAAVILSTCNRVEIYCAAEDVAAAIQQIQDFIARYHEIDKQKFLPYLYIYQGKEAIQHLFNVSCGIDSQIIGENQILEQIEFAYAQARGAAVINDFLTRIFTKAIDTGTKVRNNTEISRGNITIASIAISLMKYKLLSLQDKKLLIIGVGKICELVARNLQREKIKAVFISNRNFEKAVQLADYIGAEAVGFDNLRQKLKETDIIISATSSPHLVLKKEDFKDIHKPLLIIDLAVPRDVDPEVKYIEGINLFCLDDLDFLIEKNLEKRKNAIPQALKIIEHEVESLWSQLTELEPEPALLP